MAFLGKFDYSSGNLPSPEIDTFALSLSRPEEQAFVHGCNAFLLGREDRAFREFKRAARIDREFMDAWFMIGFIELLNGRAERARQAFLHILQAEEPFYGIYILRFMPTFRPHVNLFEDFVFHIMPTTGDVAAITAHIYLIEKRNRAAKKVIHPAFREYPNNPAVQVVWARSMLTDNAPDEVINEIDMKIHYHGGKTELDILLTHLIGQAYLDMDDFRSAISHWEGLLHNASGKNPRLIDRFRIHLATAYEHRGYLIDVLEILKAVEDPSMQYEDGISVDFKLGQVVEKINTYKKQGIRVPLQYHNVHQYPRWKPSQGYLETN